MKKIETTYKDFFDMLKENPDREFYVENHKGELTRVLGCIQKEGDMLYIELNNNYIVHCSTEHHFMDKNGDAIAARDLKIHKKIQTTKGLASVTSVKRSKETSCYDISIEYPHWYVNDEYGVIHHNTGFCLVMAKAYMDKYPDGVLLYMDSEFGTPRSYFETFNIDTSRVLHVPITDIEQLKFDLMKQIDAISRDDHVIIIIDSIGNLASRKEVDDALDGKSVADMTRSKQLKSLFRMITPHLTIKNIPLLSINHVYSTLELHSKPVVGGGTGGVYSSDTVFIVGRQQEKEGTDVAGYNFIINIDKSRFVREKSKIPINVMFEGGISKYSGLIEMAMEAGLVHKPSMGWYSRIDLSTGEIEPKKWRLKQTNTKEFWDPILQSQEFQEWVKNNYQIANKAIISDDDIDEVMTDIDDEDL